MKTQESIENHTKLNKFHTSILKVINPYLFFLLPLFSSSFSLLLLFLSILHVLLSKCPNERPKWVLFGIIFLLLHFGPQTLLYLKIKLCHLYHTLPSSYIMNFMSRFDKFHFYPCILYKSRVSKFSHIAK